MKILSHELLPVNKKNAKSIAIWRGQFLELYDRNCVDNLATISQVRLALKQADAWFNEMERNWSEFIRPFTYDLIKDEPDLFYRVHPFHVVVQICVLDTMHRYIDGTLHSD